MTPRSDTETVDAPGSSPRGEAKSMPQVVAELWELATGYAKQETIDPLKGLGRFLAWGVSGAVALGIGVGLLLLAGLRALQTETDTSFTGNLSWVPYVIVVAVGLVLIALALLRVSKRKGPGA